MLWKGRKQMRKGKMLTMSILAALTACGISGGVVQAADYNLDTIYVEGERDKDLKPLGSMAYETQNVGLLGQKDALDTPFTSMTINAKEASYFASPARTLTDVLTLNPSVRNSSSSMYNDISIRGFNLNGHQMYVNGIPGLLDQQHSADIFIDNVTVVSGPNLGIAGTPLNQSVGGTVEIQSKRAESLPNTDLKLSYLGGSSFQQSVDVGRRFGENQRYGIRVMGANTDGETVIDDEKLTQRDFFVNVDQKTSNSKTNILVGYDYVHHQAAPTGVYFGSKVTDLPGAPDSGKNYKPSWYYQEYDNWITAINHEQKLNEHVTAFINAGYHREDWYGYVDGAPSVTNNAGNYDISQTISPLALTRKYLGVGIKGKFNWGVTEHNYMLNFDKDWLNYWLDPGTDMGTGHGNLQDGYTGGLMPTTQRGYAPKSRDLRMTGWHVMDNISMLNNKLQFMLGLHGHEAIKTPANGEEQKYNAISPTYAVNYKITSAFSVYASHTENFDIGTMVPKKNSDGIKYENHDQFLDPTKAKQDEVGFKYKANDHLLHTLSFYRIEKANYNDLPVGDKLYYVEYGKQKSKGFEYTVAGSLNEKWDFIGGINYLNAKQALTGKAVNGAAKWSGTLGVVYKPNDAMSWIARAQYLGTSTINNEALKVPSYVVFDFGATYKTKLNETPVTFTAMIYNVFGRDYWMARSEKKDLVLSTPRTFVLSAGFHF